MGGSLVKSIYNDPAKDPDLERQGGWWVTTLPHERGKSPANILIAVYLWVWLFVIVGNASSKLTTGEQAALWSVIGLRFVVFAVWSVFLGWKGFHLKYSFYVTVGPYFMATNVLTALLLAVPGTGVFHSAALVLAEETPLSWLLATQFPRVLALGTVYKTYKGLMPFWWGTLVGTPDSVYGFAVFLYWAAGSTARGLLLVIMLVGVTVWVSAPFGVYWYLPSPWRHSTSSRNTREVLSWPMVLAPHFGTTTMIEIQLYILLVM